MSLPNIWISPRLRFFCLMATGTGFLIAGCMKHPQSLVNRNLGTEKKTAQKTAADDAKRPTDDGAVVADAEKQDSRWGRNILASFWRKDADKPPVDPFLEEQLAQADAASDRPVASRQAAAVPQASPVNPFEAFQSRKTEGDAVAERRPSDRSNSSPAIASTAEESGAQNVFVEGFDSQLHRLRAAMGQDARTPSPAGQDAARDEVVKLVAQARAEMARGRPADAYRTACAAQQLASKEGMIFGPEADHPADLVAMLRDQLLASDSAAPIEPGHKPQVSTLQFGWAERRAADRVAGANAVSPGRANRFSAMSGAGPAMSSAGGPIFEEMIVESHLVPPRLSELTERIDFAPRFEPAAVVASRTNAADGAARRPAVETWTPFETERPVQAAAVQVVEPGAVRVSANRSVIMAVAAQEPATDSDLRTSPKLDGSNSFLAGRATINSAAAGPESRAMGSQARKSVASQAGPIAPENINWAEAPVPAVEPKRGDAPWAAILCLAIAAATAVAALLWRRARLRPVRAE